jgi:hypothetical protein
LHQAPTYLLFLGRKMALFVEASPLVVVLFRASESRAFGPYALRAFSRSAAGCLSCLLS